MVKEIWLSAYLGRRSAGCQIPPALARGWGCLSREPPLLKTRSHMRRNDAREQWIRLKAQGWKQVDPQWGAEVDV